ncbi:hypothetical protein ACFTAO_04350 [Paenibacillus rhizoplanae]
MYDKTDLAKEKIAELEQKTVQASEKIKALDNKKLAYLRVREKALQVYAQKKVIRPMLCSTRISDLSLQHLRRKSKERIYLWRKRRSLGQTLSSSRRTRMPGIFGQYAEERTLEEHSRRTGRKGS